MLQKGSPPPLKNRFNLFSDTRCIMVADPPKRLSQKKIEIKLYFPHPNLLFLQPHQSNSIKESTTAKKMQQQIMNEIYSRQMRYSVETRNQKRRKEKNQTELTRINAPSLFDCIDKSPQKEQSDKNLEIFGKSSLSLGNNWRPEPKRLQTAESIKKRFKKWNMNSTQYTMTLSSKKRAQTRQHFYQHNKENLDSNLHTSNINMQQKLRQWKRQLPICNSHDIKLDMYINMQRSCQKYFD